MSAGERGLGRRTVIGLSIALGALMLAALVVYVAIVTRPIPPGHRLRVQREELLSVYTVDPHTMDRRIAHYVYAPANYGLERKLELLADSLSRYLFQGLPIEVLELESLEAQTVALIDLSEVEDVADPRKSWKSGYFQGSTGGKVTTVTLRDTFLQRRYPGSWVDGVVFYYEGRSMSEWPHVMLSGVIFREESANQTIEKE